MAMLVADCQGTQRNIVAAIEAGAHPSLARCALITNVSCDSALIIALEKDDD